MSKLLIEEPPLQVLPSLAVAIGLNEAIVVQQIHYWLKSNSGKTIDGKRWIFNTYSMWATQFPFWCKETISRTIRSAEKQGVIISKQRSGFDRKKWYSLDYDRLDAIILENAIATNCSDGTQQLVVNSPQQVVALLTETPETTIDGRAENAPSPDRKLPYPYGVTDLLEMVKRVTGKTPRAKLRELICDTLGAHASEDKLKACFTEWIARDYNPDNWSGLLDWYVNGIPDKRKNGKQSARDLPAIGTTDGGFYA